MEAGDGAAGHGDKHHGPFGQAFGVDDAHGLPQLGHAVLRLEDQHACNAHCHDDEADTKKRIHLANDLIHRQEGRQQVVKQHQNQPEGSGQHHRGQRRTKALANELANQPGGTHRKVDAHHHQQDHRKDSHDELHHFAQVHAHNLRDGRAVVAFTHHTRQKVMDTATQDGSEHNPQVDHGPPAGTGQRTIDGPQSGDV